MISLIILSAAITCKAVAEDKVVITSADELNKLSNYVEQGITYNGTTVVLGADIDYAGCSFVFGPIGSKFRPFLGTFDGQGYTIKNIVVESDSSYIGLFGYIKGSIRNVVIDSSCSFARTSNYGDTDVHIGGIAGGCDSSDRNLTIENVVNMASITFNGYSRRDGYIGGIVGALGPYLSSSDNVLKNSANYGDITISGTSYKYLHIGGVVGYSYWSIKNAINYGAVKYLEDMGWDEYVGGIAGTAEKPIENCVSAGQILSMFKQNASQGSINNYRDRAQTGSITGRGTAISHSYWNLSIPYEIDGSVITTPTIKGCYGFNKAFSFGRRITVGKYRGDSLIGALNGYSDCYPLYGYSHWALNSKKNDITFVLDGREAFSLDYQVFYLPKYEGCDKKWFDGWYTDPNYTEPLEVFEIAEDTVLYGALVEDGTKFFITFDTRGLGSVDPIEMRYGETVELPRGLAYDTDELAYWETENGDKAPWSFTMTYINITFYAVWIPIQIATAEEFIEFARIVNSGKEDYRGKTVYLVSDIEFTPELSLQFSPIEMFRGTFDGQGQMINNLKIEGKECRHRDAWADYHGGLFGYSTGATIKNIVFGKSGSVQMPSYSRNFAVGGIIGECYAYDRPCNIENCVSYLSFFYDGYIYWQIHIGGIAGLLRAGYYYDIYVGNCVSDSYVSVHGHGESTEIYIGGIIGEFRGYKWDSKIEDCRTSGMYTVDAKCSWPRYYLGMIAGNEKDNRGNIYNSTGGSYLTEVSTVKGLGVKKYVMIGVIGFVMLIIVVLLVAGFFSLIN